MYWSSLSESNPGFGVYTETLGTAPHRTFIIEWRAQRVSDGAIVDAELVFNENTDIFEVVYGQNPSGNQSATAGVQESNGLGGNSSTPYTCTGNPNQITPNLGLEYVPIQGPTATPTDTPTATSTPTATNTPNPCLTGWSEQVAYPNPDFLPATAVQGNELYSFGGGGAYTYTAKYDGATWTPLTPLPAVNIGASAVSNGTYIYIVNGGTSFPQSSNIMYRYDPISNSYTTLTAPPISTTLQSAAYMNGKIYVIGGVAPGPSVTSTVQVYSIASDTWSNVTSYPQPIVSASAVAYNGYLYAAGGYDNGGNAIAKTYRYDPVADGWSDNFFADLPAARASTVGDTFNGKIVLAGGNGGSFGSPVVTNTVLSWDPASNSWSNLPDMMVASYGSGGGTLGNAFYAVGGSNGSFAIDNNQRYTLTGCATPTGTAMPTNTPGGPTNTPAPSNTPSPTNTPGGPTPTDCPNVFTDVNGNVFYAAIHYLNCRGVVNGTDATHYSPGGTSTRGQFAKVVVLGFGTPFYTPTGNPDFSDVPRSYFAFLYIESGFHAGILSGFDQASCTANGQPYPCYLPNRPITRGQLTKLVVNAAHYQLFTPSGAQTFSDVPPTNVFFAAIETAHFKGIINGYNDHTFRPNNNIRRDEMAQIVYKGVTTP